MARTAPEPTLTPLWRDQTLGTLPGSQPPGDPPPRRRVIVAVALLAVLSSGVAVLARSAEPGFPRDWDPKVVDLVRFVETARGLTFRHPIHVDFMSEEALRATVTRSQVSKSDQVEMDQAAAAWRALGLLEGGVDLLRANDQAAGDGLLGSYDPHTKRVRVRGTTMNLSLKGTLVHELTHALQDQHFDLSRTFEQKGQNDTFSAVFEGDAVNTEYAWVATLSDADQETYYDQSGAESNGGGSEAVPDLVTILSDAPYALGVPFVEVLVQAGGQKQVDLALASPPTAYAQVLDPFRFLAGEKPVPVELPRIAKGDVQNYPGKDARTDALNSLSEAMAVPVMRSQRTSALMNAGASATFARCAAGLFVGALTAAELDAALVSGNSPARDLDATELGWKCVSTT
jgi:hypothetical protein